ncbi:MAG: nucleotide exchange factor GrpE [Sphingobacteriales bacterium]|nr:nucleotide exchange factor GrpE [Sphingobacteriales bacterium]
MKEKKHRHEENNAEEMDINSDSDIPGSNHLSNPLKNTDDAGADENNKMALELEEQKDKYVRLFAEFDNYKRRTAKEKIELIQSANKDLVIDLLEVLDDMDRAEMQMAETNDIEQVKSGNALVFAKFRNILQQRGLASMDSKGSAFDVEKHEAITELEAGPQMQGKVVDVLQKGYTLNNKIIRFAKVVVGK